MSSKSNPEVSKKTLPKTSNATDYITDFCNLGSVTDYRLNHALVTGRCVFKDII